MKTDKNYQVLHDNFNSVAKSFLRKSSRAVIYYKNINSTDNNEMVIGLSMIYPLVKVAYYQEQLNFLEENNLALKSDKFVSKFLLNNIDKITDDLIISTKNLPKIFENKRSENGCVEIKNYTTTLNHYINKYGSHSLVVLPEVASLALNVAKIQGVFRLMEYAHTYLNNGRELYFQQYLLFSQLRKEGKMPGFPFKPALQNIIQEKSK